MTTKMPKPKICAICRQPLNDKLRCRTWKGCVKTARDKLGKSIPVVPWKA